MIQPFTLSFAVPGEPQSKARPRYSTRNGKVVAYTPKSTVTAEQNIALAFRHACEPGYKFPDDDAFRVVCDFQHATMQRRDVDNMLKAVLDGLNKVAWLDDAQVTEVEARKTRVPKGQAQTLVTITNLGLRDRMRKPCLSCGEDMLVYASTVEKAIYCSPECRHETHATRKARTCPQCGQSFTWLETSHGATHCSAICSTDAKRAVVACSHCGTSFTKQRCHVRAANYCSEQCRTAAMKARRMKSPPKGYCQICQAPVSRREYKRCNSCKIKGARIWGKPQPVKSLEAT